MTGKTHLAGGLAIGLSAGIVTGLLNNDYLVVGNVAIPMAILAVIACGLGGILPDIDEPNAMVSNLPKKSIGMVNQTLRKKGVEGVARALISGILMLLNLVTRSLAGLVKGIVGHRGATHWMISGVGVAMAFGLLGLLFGYPEFGLFLWVGYVSHILLDAMTLSGVEMWQPFNDHKVHLLPPGLRVRTGSFVDFGLTMLLGSCTAVLFYSFFVRTHLAQLPQLDQLQKLLLRFFG